MFPPEYPNLEPQVKFKTVKPSAELDMRISTVYHPLVDPKTGLLSLKKDFPCWTAGTHWFINVLLYMKKVFHLYEYFDCPDFTLNKPAASLFKDDFRQFVSRC